MIFFFYLSKWTLEGYNQHKKHTGHLSFYRVMMSDTPPPPKMYKTILWLLSL